MVDIFGLSSNAEIIMVIFQMQSFAFHRIARAADRSSLQRRLIISGKFSDFFSTSLKVHIQKS
jgi:hypothetical protein